ncbi:MAG: endonuclease/exonuclease/phosphatase family protein [Betaproteobacteria bacterium]|nr:endonuclease/exonuclease/phosphatase family protein [Betaproteobacteria bacterium]
MRILQWNIQWCRGIDGKVDPERIARVARELADPDVICFQEVASNFPALAGSSGEDQGHLLAHAFPGYAAHVVSGVDVPAEGLKRRRFGNMLLSRLPVRQVFRHSLPWPAEARTPGMPRAALEAVIETPLGTVRVATTHLEYYSASARAAQVERLRELHAEASRHARVEASDEYDSGPFQPFPRPAPAIVCGDFNLPPQDAMHRRMQEPFEDGTTERLLDAWQHAHPGKPHPPTFCLHGKEHGEAPYCCDYVFVSAALAGRIASVRIDLDTQASDHQPVIVEFR